MQEPTKEAQPFPSVTLLRGPLLHEASVPAEEKKKYLKEPDQFPQSRQKD